MSESVFGRDSELGALDVFLAGLTSGPAALVLAGAAGAGKTTLLRIGLALASDAGYTVLRTQPSPSDMRLAFAGVADLLGSRIDLVMPELPAPQRRALSAALLVDDPPPTPPEPNVIAAAVRNAAVLAGVVEADAGRLRFSHPLLASVVLGAIPPARRRALHALAAATAADPEEKARHRALAADAESAPIAAELDLAARLAERRGAPTVAAELAELAASLTPAAQVDDAHRRLLSAGRLLVVAGETRAAVGHLHRSRRDHPARSAPRRGRGPPRLDHRGRLRVLNRPA